MTTKDTIKGSIKTGTGAFVIVELFNLAYRLMQGLLHLLCIPLWNLQKKIQNKKPRVETMPKLREIPDEVFIKVIQELDVPAGRKLALLEQMERVKRIREAKKQAGQ